MYLHTMFSNIGQKITCFIKKHRVTLSVSLILLLVYAFILPNPLFEEPVCTVITDRNGQLLGAHIAEDGQYRFPLTDSVPDKFKKALITFEDKRFEQHWGVDIRAMLRAVKQNVSAGEIVSGGSTITMQVIRLSRKNRKRTYLEKIIEVILATRLELSYSKKEILRLYSTYAPFGGNIVGIDAAAWRYFGTNAYKLTWAESAMLAVLPNSPALIHPGRNQNKLLEKRNRLLDRMKEKGIIDEEVCRLSKDEPLPIAPRPFPEDAPHLLQFAAQKYQKENAVVKTTLDARLQKKAYQIVERHHKRLRKNGINNAAVLVTDIKTAEVLVYIGNIHDFANAENDNFVDIIQAERSTGSILKPFLYAAALTDGEILPHSLVYDIPTNFGGYTTRNYGRAYDGAVPASKALERSLNVPAVRMLRDYGNVKFYNKLEDAGMTTLHYHASHYGLSLILGGSEATLWELTGMYASMARTLLNYPKYGNRYHPGDFRPPRIIAKKEKKKNQKWTEYESSSVFSASAVWFTLKALLNVERPASYANWEMFESSEPVSWKTGTSFGFRDAWAIGVTPRYAVGVWTGNADGEGRPGLVGVYASAPLLFDIFDILPDAEKPFSFPAADMTKLDICPRSGYLAGTACKSPESRHVPKSGNRFGICPYHKIVHLSQDRKYRVHTGCEEPENILTESWFILPPAVENYYKTKNAFYEFLPPYRPDCQSDFFVESNDMALIYPDFDLKIYVPTDLDGQPEKAVFEAAHRREKAKIFWYIDNELVETTEQIHSIEIKPDFGKHTLTLVDDKGNKLVREFEIVNKN